MESRTKKIEQGHSKEPVKLSEIIQLCQTINDFELKSDPGLDEIYFLYDAGARLSRIVQDLADNLCTLTYDIKNISLPLVALLKCDHLTQANHLADIVDSAKNKFLMLPAKEQIVIMSIYSFNHNKTDQLIKQILKDWEESDAKLKQESMKNPAKSPKFNSSRMFSSESDDDDVGINADNSDMNKDNFHHNYNC